jgi:hypothetical protein
MARLHHITFEFRSCWTGREVGGNGNSCWMMNGNGNNYGIQMRTEIGMNEREWEEIGNKNLFPLISNANRTLAAHGWINK